MAGPLAFLLAAVLAGELDGTGVGRAVAGHRGRPVVLMLWATWCEPCVKEFPDLVALARQRKDVSFLAVSIDEPGDRKAVEVFVTAQRPPFPVYLKAPGRDEPFINGVDRDWSGAVPVTIVYDREGKRSALMQGEHTRADVEKALAGTGTR
jgi:thiol-disulfide isomerase/thioredoxin